MMQRLMKNLLRLPLTKTKTNPLGLSNIPRINIENSNVRTLWHICNSQNNRFNNTRNIHTKDEKESIEYLSEEILSEKSAIKSNSFPSVLEGFKVEMDGSEVTLTKEIDNEIISIFFDVNHSVDTEMKSKPNFEVDIVRGSKTLNFSCSFTDSASPETGDIFGIDEFTIYEEFADNNYVIDDQVIDGYLYDLLMNVLDEKGITNEFIDKMSNLSTSYKKALYVVLLKNLYHFMNNKK